MTGCKYSDNEIIDESNLIYTWRNFSYLSNEHGFSCQTAQFGEQCIWGLRSVFEPVEADHVSGRYTTFCL